MNMKRLYDVFLPVLQLLIGLLGLMTLMASVLRAVSLTSMAMTVALTALGLILGTHGISAYREKRRKKRGEQSIDSRGR